MIPATISTCFAFFSSKHFSPIYNLLFNCLVLTVLLIKCNGYKIILQSINRTDHANCNLIIKHITFYTLFHKLKLYLFFLFFLCSNLAMEYCVLDMDPNA